MSLLQSNCQLTIYTNFKKLLAFIYAQFSINLSYVDAICANHVHEFVTGNLHISIMFFYWLNTLFDEPISGSIQSQFHISTNSLDLL